MSGSDVRLSARELPTRVIVVDGHELFRRGLIMALSQEPDIEVVGDCADGTQALELADRMDPDLVLMDVRTPNCDQACAAIAQRNPAVRILRLMTSDDEPGPHEAAVDDGVAYLLRESSLDEVAAAIRRAADTAATGPPSPGPAGHQLPAWRPP